MKKLMKVPILFLIYNRSYEALRVMDAIKKYKPEKLYIAADGPKKNQSKEKEECNYVRESVLREINWDCKITTLFRNENLGCKIAVSNALTWFFELEEEGIILEDDCLPNSSFFEFIEKMLEYYRFDSRIMHISGSNFQDGHLYNDDDYFFSKYAYVWGWATWRRSWRYYNNQIQDEELWIFKKNYLKSIFPSIFERYYWSKKLKEVAKNKIDTWDYQWNYTLWKQGGLAVVPNYNLVENIGFNSKGTHTKNKNNKFLTKFVIINLNKLKYCKKFICSNNNADRYSFFFWYSPLKNIIRLFISSKKPQNIVSN